MNVRSYALVTAAYWALTITDGALRMLVLLHFHDLGYSPVALAFLFLLYEAMGIVTNLVGGWVGSRFGLNRTLFAGLGLQVVALSLLTVVGDGWVEWASVAFVMGTQALSGVAKDLTKMSSKSAIKFVVGGAAGDEHNTALFRWVAALTGSKNALKGVGFFIGGALLGSVGFDAALWSMAAGLAIVLVVVGAMLRADIGKSAQPKRISLVSDTPAINRLATARILLFASRDIWFVVALPVFLDDELGWSFEAIGAFLAAWVIGYGIVQSAAPAVLRRGASEIVGAAQALALGLAIVAAAIAIGAGISDVRTFAVVVGLVVFGLVFALNSSVHSFLILAYTDGTDVAVDVGFYYAANAVGRLTGTLISGVAYLAGGLPAALWTSAAFALATWLASRPLPAVAPAAD